MMKKVRKSAAREPNPRAADRGTGEEHDIDTEANRGADTDMSDSMQRAAWGVDQADVPGLSADRVAEIRRRISSDAYHTSRVAEIVARRLLSEGDL